MTNAKVQSKECLPLEEMDQARQHSNKIDIHNYMESDRIIEQFRLEETFKDSTPLPQAGPSFTRSDSRSEPSLLQAEQPQYSHPFFMEEVFQSSDHFYGRPLDPLQQVFPVPGCPGFDQDRANFHRNPGKGHSQGG